MKSQFIKVNELQDEADVPRHIAALDAWASALSPNDSSAGGQGEYRSSIVDQETVEQRAVYQPQMSQSARQVLWADRPQPQQYQSQSQQPAGVNGGWNSPANPSIQAIMRGPVSPRESGITPYAALYAGGPQAAQPQIMQAPVQPGFAGPAQSYAQPYAAMQPATFAPQSRPAPASTLGPVANMPALAMPGFPATATNQQYRSFEQLVDSPPSFAGQLQQPPMSPTPPGGKRRKKRRFPIWARVLVGLLLFLMLLTGGGYIYYLVNFAPAVNNITGQVVPRLKGDDNPNQNLNGNILSGPRINILLLGSDTDQKFGTSVGGSTVYLAQTDIIVSIDPATKSVVMLSIPRDFYINIPGFGMGKLDEAFEHGYSYGQGGFPGAVALSRATIFEDFGIPINYYAWVGLNGFVKVINTVGGVDVDVLHPITDDAYPDDVGNTSGDLYAYKRLYIPPGPQHLSGEAALEYVRSRHADLVGDFGRSARQQQVLGALKIKLDNPSILGQLTQIAQDLNGWVKTDMQLSDVIKLMNFARTLNSNSVQRVVLEPPYSSSTTLPGGESVVEPNCAAIAPELARLQLGAQTHCNIYGSSNTTQIASSQPAVTPDLNASATIQQIAPASEQFGQLASLNPLNLGGGSNDLFGMHSLLDLLFSVVFESPQAMQV